MTASWLIQMGWTDVFVLEDGIGRHDLLKGPHRPSIPDFVASDRISAAELQTILETGEPVGFIDLATSRQFRHAHIPGACWAVRSCLISDCLT